MNESKPGKPMELSFGEVTTLLNILEFSLNRQYEDMKERGQFNHGSLALQHTIAAKLTDEQKRLWPKETPA